MRLCFPISAAVFIVIVVGVNLLLYGRNRFLRRIGALMGSVTGPYIIWLAEQILLIVMSRRLWQNTPSSGNMFVIGQDITLNQLLWIPLQDAGCYILILVVFIGIYLFRGRKTSPDIELLYPNLPFDRWLDRDRRTGKRGWLVYQIMTATTILLALPVTGLVSYATLRILLAPWEKILIKTWIDRSTLGVGAIFALVYYAVNSIIALQD